LISESTRKHIRQLLETDRDWAAYALADLDPAEDEYTEWIWGKAAVVLIYSGFSPHVLFSHGNAEELTELFDQIPPAEYVYTLIDPSRKMLEGRLIPRHEERMYRMALERHEFPEFDGDDVVRLGIEDLEEIKALFSNRPDRPDAFHEKQLSTGPFYGVRVQNNLRSVAGIHILSHWASIAALGNVYTHPDYRGRGFATQASAAVVRDLLEFEINTIVLNVAIKNEPALHTYKRLGFKSICEYYEGIADLGPV
jgi:ribosomal protein S18 acetylase RimI-like enzyme